METAAAAPMRLAWYHVSVVARLSLVLVLAACAGRPATEPKAELAPAPAVSPAPISGAPKEKLRFPPRARPEIPDGPGWLGVELAAPAPADPGVVVENVLPGSPAMRAGLEAGDVILSIDGESVSRPPDVIRIVSGRRPGERLGLALSRRGQPRLVAAVLGSRPDMNELLASEFVGNPAPAFRELSAVQGNAPTELSGLRGRVVVVEFWASWCMVCRMTIPVLNAWHDRYGARGLTVLGVTTDPADYALGVSVELGISYAVASDPDAKTSRAYRALSIPTLFVIDREGTVQEVVVGYSSEGLASAEAKIAELIAR